jgi:hypothetical protein
MIYSHSAFYTSYVAPGGTSDYYDSGIATWLTADVAVDTPWHTLLASPYANYMIGITVDDGDEINGFSAGPDFATTPPGNNNYNLAMQVAAMSPTQTANQNEGWVYADTVIHTKVAMQTYLTTKYTTFTALNTAWGSSYTTLGSTGTNYTSEAFGTGDGTTLTFTHTLANLTPSHFSVQILVAGTPVAGDEGNGTVWGPNVTGSTINYTTGAISLTFKAGQAPANSAAITVNYTANGWGIGTGFMDEDDRVSHQSYLGTDWVAMSNANATVKSDMNTFLGQMAGFYFKTVHDGLKAAFPNIMILGPDSLSSWGAPPPAAVLQGAAPYMDCFLTAASNTFTQAEMDYIETNFGDKPYFGSFYTTANADSPLSAYPDNGEFFASQPLRGIGYNALMTSYLQTAQTTAGNFPYIGMIDWEFVDNYSEHLNWGMVTHFDNAYDGHESTTATVACSPPLQDLVCGGDAGNYGNLIDPMRTANGLWLNLFIPGSGISNGVTLSNGATIQ